MTTRCHEFGRFATVHICFKCRQKCRQLSIQNGPYFTGILITDNRWWSSLSYIIVIIFCFWTAEKFFPIHIFFYNCSIIRSIVLCWVSQQIYSKPILEFIEFVACSIFCSSFFRSLNSLFCCINLVKKLQKLTKDFNDRLRSRKSFSILNLNTLQS